MPNHLTDSLTQLQNLCQGLSPAQAAAKPSPSAWSIAEIVEHLAVVERGAMIGIQRALTQAPATAETLAEASHKADIIANRVAVPTSPIEAPEPVRPTGRYGDWPAGLEAFSQARQRSIALLADADGSLDTHTMAHPILGHLTIRQWFAFLASHTTRHLVQIQTILSQQ